MFFWIVANYPVCLWLRGHYTVFLWVFTVYPLIWACVYRGCTFYNTILLIINILTQSDQQLRAQWCTSEGILVFNGFKMVQEPIWEPPGVSSCQQKALRGSCVWGFVIVWEQGTGEPVLISAVSHWEAGRLQPNPEKRNAFITEQQTRKPLGSCRFSAVNGRTEYTSTVM